MAFLNNILVNITLFFNKINMLAYTIKDDEFWKVIPGDAESGAGETFEFMRDFLVGLDTILLPFMFVLCTVLTLYAIVLGVNMARAENPADAKKKIVSVISSLAAIVLIVMLLKFIVIPNMGSIFSFIKETFG